MIKLLKRLVFLVIIVVMVIVILDKNGYNIQNLLLEKIYKLDYSNYVEKYAEEYNIDKYLIYAIIKAESNFDENAVSHKEAKGLMQLMYSTAEELAGQENIKIDEEKVLEPDINIHLGTKYIAILYGEYENLGLTLAAYNAGSGNVDNWIKNGKIKKDGTDIENIPFTETNNYVRKILRDYEIYKKLYS